MSAGAPAGSILQQPRSVWAVAFACVVAFMGIGLVDPILPAIAADLHATPTQTSLLFTSYLLVTGLAMLVTSWLSSRIGAKRTLLLGLALIVVFAVAAGASNSVEAVIGFRAGWGLGNALFISTALATIVGATSGGTGAAIVLYEAALGLGIAIGPLVGGLLGSVSWRGPFFGTAALMAIGFLAITTLLRAEGGRAAPQPLSAPFRALRVPALAVLAVTALFYNIAFFVLLAYTPFALEALGVDDAFTLGLVFFGWGVALAITSVALAPVLARRVRRTTVLAAGFIVLAADLVAIALLTESLPGVITGVVVGGLVLGVINTVLTEAVMEATELPRSVASSAYSAVRFLGGAVAPPVAAELARVSGTPAPYATAAGSALLALVVLLLGRRALGRVDVPVIDPLEEAAAVGTGDA
ncbi:MFS transporter [Labedella populi]|uniref:MFS transporter n=1 Tax=Labedella populi TaxID=2498850 RepID=A0A444QFU7_9MICO|nr:MFS transporter [Labedella populi]RWZ68414.1 MFS transporter [Labedella populi]